MKILFATYPMAFHTPGGGEMQMMHYMKHLKKKGISVDLYNMWDPKLRDYDIVHFFSCISGSIHFCNFIKQLGLPLVISSSLWVSEETKNIYPLDEISSQLRLADKIISNSVMECDSLSMILRVDRDKFEVVYNGIDERFLIPGNDTAFRVALGYPGKFILNVGNIEPRKNQLNLARAMSSYPSYKLVLIGHVREENYFNQIMALDNSSQIINFGPIEHGSDLLMSAYRACEVFCLPSTLETPGLAALEAYAQKTNCVITKVGSTVEYFSDKVSYCDPNSIESIRSSINNAIKGNAKSSFKQSSDIMLWSEVVDDLINVYKRLV